MTLRAGQSVLLHGRRHAMKLISDSTKNELDTGPRLPQPDPPAKAIREKVTCDRGTAYVSAGAMDHVIRDLKKNL